MWYDYLDILNYMYIFIMVSILYDIVFFIIDEEYRVKYLECLLVDV